MNEDTKKFLKVILKKPKRSNIERWLDKHNNKLQLVRTIASVAAVAINVVVLLKVTGHL